MLKFSIFLFVLLPKVDQFSVLPQDVGPAKVGSEDLNLYAELQDLFFFRFYKIFCINYYDQHFLIFNTLICTDFFQFSFWLYSLYHVKRNALPVITEKTAKTRNTMFFWGIIPGRSTAGQETS